MGLPARHRLRRGADVTATVRRGRRTRSGPMVVHVRRPGGTDTVRLAFVAPRAVGGAVVRNRARRRVQAALVDVLAARGAVGSGDVVVRLLPGAGETDQRGLADALETALRRLGLVEAAHR